MGDTRDYPDSDEYVEKGEETLEDPRKKSTRYPYTYAYDYLRAKGPGNGTADGMSRSDASKIVEAISKATGIPNIALCYQLADYYLEHGEEIIAEVMERVGPMR